MNWSSPTNFFVILFITIFVSVKGQWNFPNESESESEEGQQQQQQQQQQQTVNQQGQPFENRFPEGRPGSRPGQGQQPDQGRRPGQGQFQPGFGQDQTGFQRPTQRPVEEQFRPGFGLNQNEFQRPTQRPVEEQFQPGFGLNQNGFQRPTQRPVEEQFQPGIGLNQNGFQPPTQLPVEEQFQNGFGQNPTGFQRPTQRPGRPRPSSTTSSTSTQKTVIDENQTQSSTNGTQLNIPNEPSVINTVPCGCPFINNYNPVCGTNGKTYANRQILDCHRTCGIDVLFKKLGSCGSNRN